jgi:hypothetical protein
MIILEEQIYHSYAAHDIIHGIIEKFISCKLCIKWDVEFY